MEGHRVNADAPAWPVQTWKTIAEPSETNPPLRKGV